MISDEGDERSILRNVKICLCYYRIKKEIDAPTITVKIVYPTTDRFIVERLELH